MASIKNDNTFVRAPKDADDRNGVFDSGVWRAYTSHAEFFTKVNIAYRYINQEVYFNISGSTAKYYLRDNLTTFVVVPTGADYSGDIAAVQTDLNNEKTTRAANDAATLSSAQAYTDAVAAGAFIDQGNWDASGGTYPTTNLSGGAVKKGNSWQISVAGTISGTPYDVGDSIRALVNTPGQTGSNWAASEHNEQQATESIRGSVLIVDDTTIQNEATTDNAKVVTGKKFWLGIARLKAIAATITGAWNFTGGLQSGGSTVEVTSNKATDFSIKNDTLYPSVKSVGDQLDTKSDKIITYVDQTASYTPLLTDAGKKIRMNVATPNTFTVPANSAVTFNIGTRLTVRSIGAGLTTLVPDTGVTLRGSLDVMQYDEVILNKEGANVWGVSHSLSDTSGLFSSYGKWFRDFTTSSIKYLASVFQQGGKGNAIKFKASLNQYFTAPATSLPTGALTMSIVGWFRRTGSNMYVLNHGDNTAGASHYMIIYLNSSGVVIYNGAGDATFATAAFSLNTWVNLMIVFTGGIIKIYINGNLLYSGSNVWNITPGSIISNTSLGLAAGDGDMQQFGIYNTDMSASAAAIAAGVSTLPGTPIIYYKCEKGTGTILDNDGSLGSSSNATLQNAPSWAGTGNGQAPLAGAGTTATMIEILDGVAANERGRVRFGDFLSGTILQGVSASVMVNNVYSMFVSSANKIFFSDRATSATVAVSTADFDGNVTIGRDYAGINSAPQDGLACQGVALFNTAADNGIDKLQVNGSIYSTKLRFPNTANVGTGSATLVAGTVTVNNTIVNAGSKVFCILKTPSGTLGILSQGTITAGTSFVINSLLSNGSVNSADTSTFDYLIIN